MRVPHNLHLPQPSRASSVHSFTLLPGSNVPHSRALSRSRPLSKCFRDGKSDFSAAPPFSQIPRHFFRGQSGGRWDHRCSLGSRLGGCDLGGVSSWLVCLWGEVTAPPARCLAPTGKHDHSRSRPHTVNDGRTFHIYSFRGRIFYFYSFKTI